MTRKIHSDSHFSSIFFLAKIMSAYPPYKTRTRESPFLSPSLLFLCSLAVSSSVLSSLSSIAFFTARSINRLSAAEVERKLPPRPREQRRTLILTRLPFREKVLQVAALLAVVGVLHQLFTISEGAESRRVDDVLSPPLAAAGPTRSRSSSF